MASIKRYQISVPQEKLDLLQRKLALTTLPDELEGSGWDYGAPLADIKRLLTHWRTNYDWRAHEHKINTTLPQFTTDIEIPGFGAITTHFVHQQSATTTAIPLLFCHGWPGHFLEVSKILPLLVHGGNDHPAFHVVAPSLPNFGFSQGIAQKGFGLHQYAHLCHKLMLALGYTQYATQGGDWGFTITRLVGHHFPAACRASHINMYPGVPSYRNPLLAAEFFAAYLTGLSPALKRDFDRINWFQAEGSGYFKLQSTKPQTIGYALSDSPVALLAWIYEKLHDWTDSYPWSDDELLTWVCIYAFSAAGPAAAGRIYYETKHDGSNPLAAVRQYNGKVKLGVGKFPRDIAPFPPKFAAGLGDLVFKGEHERGGHFAAWEDPEGIVGDLRGMFGREGGAYGVVEGRSGFEAGSRL